MGRRRPGTKSSTQKTQATVTGSLTLAQGASQSDLRRQCFPAEGRRKEYSHLPPSLKHSRSPLTKAEKRERNKACFLSTDWNVSVFFQFCQKLGSPCLRQKEKQYIQRIEKQNILCAACGLLAHAINQARKCPRAGSRNKVPTEKH